MIQEAWLYERITYDLSPRVVNLQIISKEGGLLLKDNFEGGATWAYEVGSQSMVCPIIVEDLNQPRQMLVEVGTSTNYIVLTWIHLLLRNICICCLIFVWICLFSADALRRAWSISGNSWHCKRIGPDHLKRSSGKEERQNMGEVRSRGIYLIKNRATILCFHLRHNLKSWCSNTGK